MADERKRLHDRKLIRLADHNASGLQLLHRRVVLLYIRARAADRRNKVKCPAFRLGPLLQGMDRRKQRAGHIRMRTVAQHDIEEDHARRGIFNGLLHAFDPLGGIDHRMRTHGTGCTLSSAIASNLAKGYDLETAVRRAKAYISGALAAMLDLGRGSGPMNHAFALDNEWSKEAEA